MKVSQSSTFKKNLIKNLEKDLNRHFTKEDTQKANKLNKRCGISLTDRKMQIKTTLKYPYTLIRITKIKNGDNTRCYQSFMETHILLVEM